MRSYMIFDLDGTLIDSMPIWNTFGMDYLDRKAVSYNSDIGDMLKALSMEQAAELFKKQYNFSESIEELVNEMNVLLKEYYETRIPLKSGVKETLIQWKEEGIRMCVATASDYDLTKTILKRHGIDQCFDFIITCAQVRAGKDVPVIFDEAATRLGASKDEVVIFEDSLHAVRTAALAGFYVVGVYDEASEMDVEPMKKYCNQYINMLSEYEEEEG